MSTQIYDLIDLNQSKSGLCIRKNNHYTNRAFRAEDEVRTRDPQLGRLMLYRLSYFRIKIMVGAEGVEPATPGVTGRYSNQLNYRTNI